ncbi:unnamed protein product [Schistocephalus solidus]|uniref:PepX_C domain-containing protein n=1 Tax=Schistocephalus solidus TaxID=70667 RepID=A0A183SWK9_SCHSO|nr:unnamed protein product [Schistocephalus solidus]
MGHGFVLVGERPELVLGHPRRLPNSTMGHGFGLVEERPRITQTAAELHYGSWFCFSGRTTRVTLGRLRVDVAPTVGLFERGEFRKSDIPGVEAHTTPETLTWFSPPVVMVARVWPLGKTNFEEPQVKVGYQLEAATGAFTTCRRQMERPNAICVVLPLASTPTPPPTM